MSEFFNMGGYAAYVWPCYLLTAVIFTWLAVGSYRAYRAAALKVRQLEARTAKDAAKDNAS